MLTYYYNDNNINNNNVHNIIDVLSIRKFNTSWFLSYYTKDTPQVVRTNRSRPMLIHCTMSRAVMSH